MISRQQQNENTMNFRIFQKDGNYKKQNEIKYMGDKLLKKMSSYIYNILYA